MAANTEPLEVLDEDDELTPELDADGNPVVADDEEDADNISDEYVAPTKEEFDKLQRQLKRANTQVVKLKQAPKPTEENSEDAVEDAVKAAREEVENKYKTRIVNSEASAQLKSMGLKGDPKRLLKLLDLSDIDVEDDGIEGLEDQLEEFKADYPDLFDNRKIKGDRRLSTDAADKVSPLESMTFEEKLAKQFGR